MQCKCNIFSLALIPAGTSCLFMTLSQIYHATPLSGLFQCHSIRAKNFGELCQFSGGYTLGDLLFLEKELVALVINV